MFVLTKTSFNNQKVAEDAIFYLNVIIETLIFAEIYNKKRCIFV